MRRFVLVVLLVGVALAGCAPAAAPSATQPPAATPTASAAATPSPVPSTSVAPTAAAGALADRLEAEIEVPGSPDWPLDAFDSIWVVAPDLPMRPGGGTPNLVRIDPATNETVATIALPDRLCQGFTASDDAIWACTGEALVRIDPASNTIVDSVPAKIGQAFYQLAFGDGKVWALGNTAFLADTVIRLDPETSEMTTFQMPGTVGGLAYAFDALWLTVVGEGTLIRLDPATGEPEVVAEELPAPAAIAAGPDSLWVSLHGADGGEAAPGDTQLVRIDPGSGEVLAEFEIGGSPKGGVSAWADGQAVLVRSTTPWLTVIDPATNEVVETITSDRPIQGPVTVAFGSIWTTAIEEDVVYRLSR